MKAKNASHSPQLFLATGFLIMSFLFLGGVVFGVGKPAAVGNPTISGPPSTTSSGRPSGTPGQGQLTAGSLRACQARESAITQRTTHLIELVTTMESKFDDIAKRTEDYYTTKVVPSGKTVANYTTLVSDIETKKAAVATAVTTAQTDGTGFTCTGNDPKGQLTQFRIDMQNVIKALKDYRTSIKNLIVAVHSVTGETERTTPETSGKPSITPKATQSGGVNE